MAAMSLLLPDGCDHVSEFTLMLMNIT
jgi:hypothetical protein